jgi:Mg/Co/Ni transporter MgtE
MAEAARLTETVRDLLESGRRARLSQVLEEAHAADIAAALRDLALPDQVTLFRLLGRESAGAVLAELDDQPLHELARVIPLLLKSFRVDPAIASSVIITIFTDVFGFFSFLGLATLLIRFLL